jgi:hypothetical protein
MNHDNQAWMIVRNVEHIVWEIIAVPNFEGSSRNDVRTPCSEVIVPNNAVYQVTIEPAIVATPQ